MTTLSFFDFTKQYQGLTICCAQTGRKLIKAGIYNAFNGNQSVLLTLDKNPEYIIRERTAEENDEWNSAIENAACWIKRVTQERK